MKRSLKNRSMKHRASKKLRRLAVKSRNVVPQRKPAACMADPEELVLLGYAIRTKEQGDHFISRLRSL